MSDGLPPLPSTDRSDSGPGDRPASGLDDTLNMFRLKVERWRGIPPGPPTKAAATVIGALLVLAWARFGFQGIESPRAITRLVLVGVYGWLGLTALVLIGLRLAAPLAKRLGTAAEAAPTIDPVRLLQVIGLCHQPLIVLAVAIVIGHAVPIPFVLPVLTTITFAIWLPGQLFAAVTAATGLPRQRILPIVFVAYGLWVVTVGRHLLGQLGHLI